MFDRDKARDIKNSLLAGVKSPEAGELQPVADTLMAELRTLDLSDPKAAVGWLDRFGPLSETAGVFFDAEEILRRYAAAGYRPGFYNTADFARTARTVVGNALECYQDMGSSHPLVNAQIARLKQLYPQEFEPAETDS